LKDDKEEKEVKAVSLSPLNCEDLYFEFSALLQVKDVPLYSVFYRAF